MNASGVSADMSEQGWKSPNPVTDWKADHQKGTNSQGFTYKAPGFNPDTDMISPSEGDTYIAGTVPKLRLPRRRRRGTGARAYLCEIAISLESIQKSARRKFFENYNPSFNFTAEVGPDGGIDGCFQMGPNNASHPGLAPILSEKLLKARERLWEFPTQTESP